MLFIWKVCIFQEYLLEFVTKIRNFTRTYRGLPINENTRVRKSRATVLFMPANTNFLLAKFQLFYAILLLFDSGMQNSRKSLTFLCFFVILLKGFNAFGFLNSLNPVATPIVQSMRRTGEEAQWRPMPLNERLRRTTSQTEARTLMEDHSTASRPSLLKVTL